MTKTYRWAILGTGKIGNRFGGLPFTVVVDREGAIRHRQPGELTQSELEPILEELL